MAKLAKKSSYSNAAVFDSYYLKEETNENKLKYNSEKNF